MATAKKLPSGSWSVRVLIGKDENGKKKYKRFTGSDKRKVEREAAAYADEHRTARKVINFGVALDNYIKSKKNILSPTTIDGYEKEKRNSLAELKNVPVDSITNDYLQNYINTLSTHYSPKSVKNAYGLIVSVIQTVDPYKRFAITLPKVQKEFKNLPTPVKILQAVKGTNVELPVLLALWLSLRMSEVRGIRRTDISKDGVLTINNVRVRTTKGDLLKSETKTYDSKRRFQLPPYILDLINKTDTEFIVPEVDTTIRSRFDTALENAGLEKIRFHDLRHLNASVMESLGVPEKYAMERGGWSTPGVMKGTYQHTFDDTRKEIDQRIDNYFEKLFSQPPNTKDDTKDATN